MKPDETERPKQHQEPPYSFRLPDNVRPIFESMAAAMGMSPGKLAKHIIMNSKILGVKK